jgi:hypothetical protein
MEKYKKHLATILIALDVLKVYGSLILNKFNFISDDTWCYIHYVGTATILCGFLYLLKDKVNPFLYSLGMSIFISRLITQVCSDGQEYWYEMISVITITSGVYLILKFKNG